MGLPPLKRGVFGIKKTCGNCTRERKRKKENMQGKEWLWMLGAKIFSGNFQRPIQWWVAKLFRFPIILTLLFRFMQFMESVMFFLLNELIFGSFIYLYWFNFFAVILLLKYIVVKLFLGGIRFLPHRIWSYFLMKAFCPLSSKLKNGNIHFLAGR